MGRPNRACKRPRQKWKRRCKAGLMLLLLLLLALVAPLVLALVVKAWMSADASSTRAWHSACLGGLAFKLSCCTEYSSSRSIRISFWGEVPMLLSASLSVASAWSCCPSSHRAAAACSTRAASTCCFESSSDNDAILTAILGSSASKGSASIEASALSSLTGLVLLRLLSASGDSVVLTCCRS